MRPWYLGNTTVRSPFRLRDGLVALSTSALQGNLRGREQEIALRRLLGDHGIVELGDDQTYSVGRKWRSALCKLGFLYPEVPRTLNIPQQEIGPVDMITPNGWRLIRAESVPAMQECFLRALAAHYIPSALERDFDYTVFSPLRHTLSIMLELERRTGNSHINFIEMAVIVQLTSGDTEIGNVVEQVLTLRQLRVEATNKRQFDRNARDEAAQQHGYVANTFNDYADTNLRYLKATGLVQSRGRGISLVPEKHLFVERLIADTGIPDTDRTYLQTLCNGAQLPTDNRDTAYDVLTDLIRQARERGIIFNVGQRPTQSAGDIAVLRHDVEDLLAERNEEDYAERQAEQWQEITAYMELLVNHRNRTNRTTLADGTEIEIPQAEAPAYFEWILWRAFLAINSLVNKPYQARRFKIDQDFLPVGTAPGNGPDLIFEFNDFILVVEVTLTTNSRQEAAEGEPVRRHVAEIVLQNAGIKPVYGLFLANRIDSNTAETFRIGIWYTNNDVRMELNIIPITLTQFRRIFEAIFTANRVNVAEIRQLLDACRSFRHEYEAPAWKQQIELTVSSHVLMIQDVLQ